MGLSDVQATWEKLGRRDPFWAVLTLRPCKHNRWEPGAFFETGRREVEEALAHVRGLGVELRFGRALDFGCGVGRLCRALGERFDEVVGLDIAAPMLDVARRHNRHGDRCRFVLNTRGDLGLFGEGTFDFVYSNITLQHVPPEHSTRYVAEFFRVLRPGGVALFQMPAGEATGDRTPAGRWRRWRRRHVAPWRKRIRRLLGIPVIDNYPVARETVESVIASAGAELLDVAPDASAGRGWESYRYCATVPAACAGRTPAMAQAVGRIA